MTDEGHWSSGPTLTAAAPNDTSKEIVCSVCANPQPTFLWTFKNESLREGIHVTGNKIVINHVMKDDFGTYQCMANTNINGQNRIVVFEINMVERGRFYLVNITYMFLQEFNTKSVIN